VLSLIINMIAALIFVVRGHLIVDAVYMFLIGTLVGGWLGAMLILRLSPTSCESSSSSSVWSPRSDWPSRRSELTTLSIRFVDEAILLLPQSGQRRRRAYGRIGVVTMALVALVTNTAWLLIPLTYGFVARVAAGPKISPLGQFAVRMRPRDSRGSKSPFPDHRSASPKRSDSPSRRGHDRLAQRRLGDARWI